MIIVAFISSSMTVRPDHLPPGEVYCIPPFRLPTFGFRGYTWGPKK